MLNAKKIFRIFLALNLTFFFTSFSLANNKCVNTLRNPKVYSDAKIFNMKHPEVYNNFVTVFVESGFFLGPKMLNIFERQLINDGMLIWDLNNKSFVETKEQAKANHESLEHITNASKESLMILSGKLFEAMKECLALNIPGDSEKLMSELTEQMAFKDRPWDARETTIEELISNHHVLHEMIKSEQGQALVLDLILETIPLYAHMLDQLLIYTNQSVDLASVLAGKIGWSVVLSSAVGFIDPWTVTEVAAAAAGALVEMPGMTKALRYYRNRKIQHLQQEVGWNMAAEMRCKVH